MRVQRTWREILIVVKAVGLCTLAINCGGSDDFSSDPFADNDASRDAAPDNHEVNSNAGASGADASKSDAGAAGDDAGESDATTQDGASGNAGAGGTAGGGGSGTGGSGGCVTKTWCFDDDTDGHGNPDNTQSSCSKPGTDWVASCDDCHDGNSQVHPGASSCHASPFTQADGTTLSFDYDCNGQETVCEGAQKANEQGCVWSGLLGTCTGSGYLPNPDRPAQGAAFDRYCGSTLWRNCAGGALGCSALNETRPAVTCL
jgi:hypothetical protein